MSRQRDLLGSMVWRIIRRQESGQTGQTQRNVVNAVGKARSVIVRLWYRFQETGHIRRRPGKAPYGPKKVGLSSSRLDAKITFQNRWFDDIGCSQRGRTY
ncbi:hypothetical protein TNCV_1255501 [Trichonephila clavipes]|nr:hypothetical protein TNCV_1255501 [Trichonephila clavipes]